jgi:thiol-disulfide isomerase/thioredoxin
MMLPFADGAARARRVLHACLAALAMTAPCVATRAAAPVPALDLDQYRGKVVVLDFWASWCKPCRQSIPWLNEMKSRYARDGLVVIGVNVDAEHADAERFMHVVPIDFDVVFDPDGALAKRFKLQGMPSSFVFDRAGKMVESRIGFREAQKADHEADLRRLLSNPVH